MNNDVQRDASCSLFQFEGELRADHVEGLYALAMASSEEEPRCILVDCHRVTRFHQDAVEALVAFQQAMTDLGHKVMLVGVGHPELDNVVFLGPKAPEAPVFQAM
jgi:anti-anti-sigma regulatory factor